MLPPSPLLSHVSVLTTLHVVELVPCHYTVLSFVLTILVRFLSFLSKQFCLNKKGFLIKVIFVAFGWNDNSTLVNLGVLKHFKFKNQTKKIVTCHTDFELYQVFMYSFLCQTVLIFTICIAFTKTIETFWSRDVTDIWVLAHLKLKIYKKFWTYKVFMC